ncbi:MAG: aminotransferase class III-fold pyridoxal phosphate-dependent enzyme [Candidatus Eremiobacteraeota bacterium]|nr:aminotransferase class III-fold pyridoxal phosphate-dependent enzyme [Candidatus Eremiobacteraeota bacterium]
MLAASSETLVEKHARYVLSPWIAQKGARPPVIVRAHGSTLVDADGKEYIDLTAGLVAVNLGHGHAGLAAAIGEQAGRVAFSPPAWGNDRRAELAERLVHLVGWPNGGRAFFTTGGADALDDAAKILRLATGRPKILTAYRSFHGSSAGASSMTGESRRWPAEPGMPGVVHFLAPYPYRSPFSTTDPHEETKRALEHLELILSYEDAERIAAIVLEPIVGSNGIIVYPDGYLAGVRKICDKHGIALVFDEVMTGFGRTGAAFAAHRFGVMPDVIAFAKGVTSAYVPLGGLLLREEIAGYFDDHVLWAGHTYSGHPVAMAAGVATLDAYRDENVFEKGLALEGPLRDGLERLARAHRSIGEVRGVGAFFAIELVKDRKTREPVVPWQGKDTGVMATFNKSLRERGAWVLTRYNFAAIAPPLTIEKGELERGFEALDGALGDLEKALG